MRALLTSLLIAAQQRAAAFESTTMVETPAPPPNVLLLFADDLGINQANIPGQPLSYTGVSGAIKTPNLAKMASEGTTFMQWYSAFHVCTPSRASLMTARLPVRLGLGDGVLAPDATGGLQLNETTMAETLRRLGYATAMFGKWHLGQREQYLPHNRGFDIYFGIPFSCDMGCGAWHGPHPTRCFPSPLPLLSCATGSVAKVEEQPTNLATLTQRYADFGAAFIANHSAADRPWFLFASFNHVHVTDANYSKANPPPGYSDWQFSSVEFCGSSGRGGTGDAVQELDDAVGQLLASVKRAGAERKTITFFTSDNGNPEYGDMLGNLPLRGYKASNWEGGVREPAIVRWPGRIPAGVTSWALATTYDIYPTVMRLAGGSMPPGRVYDGKDLSAVLLSGASTPHACLFHWHDSELGQGGRGLSAVRCGDYKAHFYTQNDYATEANRSKSWPAGKQDPPLLFLLTQTEQSETVQVDPASEEYASHMKVIGRARDAHLASIAPVCSQNKASECGGTNWSYAICADHDSKSKFPQWPLCTITPAGWTAKTCV